MDPRGSSGCAKAGPCVLGTAVPIHRHLAFERHNARMDSTAPACQSNGMETPALPRGTVPLPTAVLGDRQRWAVPAPRAVRRPHGHHINCPALKLEMLSPPLPRQQYAEGQPRQRSRFGDDSPVHRHVVHCEEIATRVRSGQIPRISPESVRFGREINMKRQDVRRSVIRVADVE